jgi:uncharacterized cupin superfamily protein
MRHRHVVNEKDVEGYGLTGPEGFDGHHRRLGAAAGSRQLGCTLSELPPGKAGFPFHAHYAIEEAVFVLSGTGTVRIGADSVAIGPGDYVALPTGRECAHQVINTGTETLRYLCLSNTASADVCVYPDSDKMGVYGSVTPGKPEVRAIIDMTTTHSDYWKGESRKP